MCFPTILNKCDTISKGMANILLLEYRHTCQVNQLWEHRYTFNVITFYIKLYISKCYIYNWYLPLYSKVKLVKFGILSYKYTSYYIFCRNNAIWIKFYLFPNITHVMLVFDQYIKKPYTRNTKREPKNITELYIW